MMIKFRGIIQQLPGYFFWKDKDSNYLGANDNLIKSASLNSADEIIGKNDYQMPWEIFADKYRFDDQRIIGGKQEVHFEEHHKDVSGRLTLATVNKRPLYDEKDCIAGVIGIYSTVPIQQNLHRPKLPKRQLEVLIAVTHGLSAKQIALQLN